VETKEPETPAMPPGTTFTSEQIAKMCKVNNSLNPLVLLVEKVMASWTGHILDKDDGK
ncbi:hypothetical protein C0989_004447, partial [Termitomyces sp. Mn162]